MAGQTATMEFPVSISAQISNLKDLRTTLTNTLNAAGKDSSLAKTLTKDLAKVNQLINEAEEFTLSPTIDATGLKVLERTFNKFFQQMQTSLQTVDLASFEQMASTDDIARLKELTAEAAKYRRELEAINKSGSAEQTGKVLERTGNQDIAKRGSTYKEFNTTATLNKNAAAMSKAADAYAQQAAAMQAGIDKLAQELSQAEANSEKAKNKAKILEQNLAAVNIDTRAADFHHKAGRFATNYSAEQNIKNPTLETIQSGLRATLESVYAGGKIATDMRATVKDWIKNLLPDVKDVDADNMVKKSVNDLLEDLMEGIFGSDYRSNPNLAYNVHHARILGNAQSYSAREIGRINAQYGVSGGQDLKVISAGINRELKQVRAEEREYNSEIDKKLTSWDEATDRQKEFTEAAAGARQLANELENLAKAEQEAARAAKEAQIEENEQNQLDLKNARTSGVKNSGAPGRQNMGYYKTAANEVFDDTREVLGGKQAQINEAAQFTANLKQSVKTWMSAQQIINIVKQGIRQAYQDIQGLDKAMTNIAVVTDMSVGDLWGKINEYMSIAQQYGVSTQGVYEVSQLYYQQGLGTADVMAATTETLKMARIAGMDYAEAADAMTVAIRSFKMEMSDAAHVTDVYSKVAAVTASDSEELAIAMSKTASSAESVGSSFENTTAMLAVMIETTRESAQNLGSALKSIISRYGEMKVGMTVDSEGEALDYNKVDTALQSVGISLKDAQGQFRDFDEVIFELSEKWDSLDSVTQRYIATIMAGNRQQSRFIALVDNWERLDEVAGAAEDSEDAGLLQYAKTLDSLETKITNIKTSFQEFYMSLVNGPVVGAALEGINNILKGFNKLGNWQAILNIAGFIRSVKSIAKLLVSAISPSFSSIVSDFKSSMQEMVEVARQKGYEAGKGYSENFNAGANGQPAPTSGSGSTPTQQSWLSARMVGDKSGRTSWSSNSWNGSKMAGRVQISGQLIGAAASIVGSSVAKDNQRAGAVISGVGNIAQGASMGAALGPWGAVIGGVIGGLASLPAVLDAFDPASVLQEKLEKAEEALSEANIERATKREEARNLEATINNLEKLQKARYSSEEAEQAFIDASNAAFEQFPQLTATFDEAGNAIIDVINNSAEAEYLLVEARKQAAEATVAAASAELKVAQTKLEQSNLELNQGAKALSKKTLQTGQHYSGTLAKAFDEMKEDTIIAAGYGRDWWDYSKAVYGKSSLMSTEGRDWNAPGYQFEREIEAVNNVSDLVRIYQRGQKQVASGEDTTGGIALVLKKVDEVMEKAIEGKSSEGTWIERYLLQLQENEQLQKSVRAGQKAVGYAYTNQLITNADPLNEANWKKINNSSSFLQKWVYEQAQLTDGDFVDGELTSDAMARVSQLFQSTLVDYETFFTSLGYQFEDFNNIIASASKGTLSSTTLLDQFQALFGSDMSTWGSVVEQYWLTIGGDIESNITRLKEDLESNRTYDWSSYIKGEEYQQAIQSLPIAYFSQISEFADDIDTRLQSGALTNTQAEKIIKEYFKTLNDLTSDTLGLTSSQLSEAQQLLTEAASNGSLFSITGIQELITQLADAGIDIEELNLDQFPVYTANLITEWASFEDKLISNLTAATEAMQKASEGMTLEEATSLANRIDLDLTTDFEFIDGKWFTTNIQAIKAYYTTQTNAIKRKFNEQVEKLLGTDTSSGLFEGITEQTLNDLKGKKTVESLGENATEEQIALWRAVQTYWDQEHYQTWVANTKKEVGEDADTSLATYWAKYFTNLGQTIDTATAEALEYWTNESQKQAEAATRLAALKSQSQIQADKISAYETIASQGVKGYSSEDLNTIIGALGWDNSYYAYDSTTGAYDLKEKALNSIPLLYRNQILASIDAEVQAAVQAIESLGSNIFDASDADYSEAFSYLAKAGFQSKEIKKGINYALIRSVVGDPEQLKEYIGKQLAHEMGRTYDEDGVFAEEFSAEITAISENMTAAFKDSYIEQIKQANDLIYKKITGTATFVELEELNDLVIDLNIDLSEFTGNLINDLGLYAQRIVDNAYLSAEEQDKGLQEAFKTRFKMKASQDMGVNALDQDMLYNIDNFTEESQTLINNKNKLTKDQLSAYASAIMKATGMSFEAVVDLFKYNIADQTFSFDTTKGSAQEIWLIALYNAAKDSFDLSEIGNLNELLGDADSQKKLINLATFSQSPELINILASANIFEQMSKTTSQAQVYLQEDVASKFASSVEDFASGQETSLQELIKLYGEFGEELSLEKATYLLAKGPQAIAQDLLRIAEDSTLLNDVDKESINDALERGAQALLEKLTSIIDAAIEGSASLDDLFVLTKNTGMNLSGKVRKTATGYGLNQAGMLSVAASRAIISGDYAGEAQGLLDTYLGTGRIFGTEELIDEAMRTLQTAEEGLKTAFGNAQALVDQMASDNSKLITEEQKQLKDQRKAARDQAKAQLELNKAEQAVLQAAKERYKQSQAQEMLDFMERDPFSGQTESYDTWIENREAAREALKSIYSEDGITDYKTAAQLVDYMGFTQNWSEADRRKHLQTVLDYTSEKGTDFYAVMNEVFGMTGTGKELLYQIAAYMDNSEQVALEQYRARIADSNRWIDNYNNLMKTEPSVTATNSEISAGVLNVEAMKKNLTDVYGTLGLTEEVIEEMAQIQYGDDWQTELADSTKRQEFYNNIKKMTEEVEIDYTSQASPEEQYLSYLKGESAAQEVSARLTELENRFNNLTTDESIMDGLNQGLELSIQKALELNRLLAFSNLGNAWTTGLTKEGTYTGVISAADSVFKKENENTSEELNNIREQLAQVYGIENTDAIEIQWNDNNIATALTYEGNEASKIPAFNYSLQGKEYKPSDDSSNEIKFTGKFEEIDKELEKYKYIEGIYTLTTPDNFKQNLDNKIKALQKELTNLSPGTDSETITKIENQIAELQKLQQELNTRYPENEDSGGVQLKISGEAPENAQILKQWKDNLKAALAGAGNVPLVITDEHGDPIDNIDDITAGQKITITAGLPEGTTEDDVKGLVDNLNGILSGLENPDINIDVTSLNEGAALASDLVTNLSNLEDINIKDITINLPGGADVATVAQSIYNNLEAVDGKDYSATMNLTIQAIGPGGKAIVFDENGFVINTEKEEALAGQIAILTSDNEKLTAENTELNRQLADESEKNAFVDAQNASLQEQLTTSEAEIATLTESLSEKEAALAAKTAEKEALAAQLADAQAESEAEIATLTESLSEKETALAAKSAEITTLTESLSEKEAALTAKSAEIESLAAQLTNTQNKSGAQIAMLISELASTGAEIARLEKENWALTGQLNAKGDSKEQSKEEPTPEPTPGPESESKDQQQDNSFSLDLDPAMMAETARESNKYTQTEKTELSPKNVYLEDFEYVLDRDTARYFTGYEGTLNERYQHIFQVADKDPQTASWVAEDLMWIISSFNDNDTVETFNSLLDYAIKDAEADGDSEKVQDLTAIAAELASIAAKMEKVPDEETDMGQVKQKYAEYGMAINSLIAQYIGTTGKVPLDASGNLIQIDLTSFDDQIATILANYEANPAEIPIGANTLNAENKAKTAVSLINGMSATLNVTAKVTKVDSSGFVLFNNANGNGEGGSEGGLGEYTGNVNGIAYADGNIDKLINGAHLANKTLVGELGPEMAVWDGQYHILGQYGAEFANVPSDAIVFNHRQTEGILKGQWGHRGKALNGGNLGKYWDIWNLGEGRYNSYSDWVSDFLKPSSGKKAVETTVIEDLEEWYNLLRKIAKLEAEINLAEAERANMISGHETLRSYREEQALLHEQIALEKLLIDYQKEELKLEAENIKKNKFWGDSLTFNEDGTLLSVFGNETDGGKGVFAYLDQLNQLSGDAQVAAIKKLGYSYKDSKGEELDGKELVDQFIKEYQEVVGDYNELDDSILNAETTIQNLITSINELEKEIKENQKELEQTIYDLLVDLKEQEIDNLEEQIKLTKEANQEYIKGLTDALNAEQQLYEQNQSIEDRESLQRQLALLRRSGGSAAEIADLETQINDALKTEYFDAQKNMIDELTDANERQIELMEQQVTLLEETQEYQEKNGIIWSQVSDIMSGSYDSILSFLTGSSTEFFEASALEQEDMLLDWAKMVGIYDEDRVGKIAEKDAAAHWNDGTVEAMLAADTTESEYKDEKGNIKKKSRTEVFNDLSEEDKIAAQEHYNAAYVYAILQGQSIDEAKTAAYNSMVERLRVDENLGIVRWDPHGDGKGTGKGTSKETNVKKQWYVVSKYSKRLSKGHDSEAAAAATLGNLIGAASQALAKAKAEGKDEATIAALAAEEKKYKEATVKYYSTGGLVNYTGLAMVHGSQSKPEAFLNASQTAQISEALQATSGKESVLEGLRSTMHKLQSLINNISNINTTNNQSISIAPGAVVIQVDEIADSYDIEELSNDVMNRMVNIASKATNRGVSRR